MKSNIQQNIESEITALYATVNMINGMVSNSILEIPYADKDVVVRPHAEVHQKFFNILLVELLSGPQRPVLGLNQLKDEDKDLGYLAYIRGVYHAPQIYNINGQKQLQKATEAFISWLNGISVVDNVWLPSIDTELTLEIRRISFIKICGDISKHGFIRLDRRIRDLIAILANHSITISEEQAYLMLPEFYEWFHDDIFNYHISNITEFLNNITWAIYEYIEPIRDGSFTLDENANLLIKNMFGELKRFEPHIPKFTTTRFLKMRY